MQIDCRSSLCQNKPLTWTSKEVQSKFHSNKVMLITNKAREWREKIETEAKHKEKPVNDPDYH